MIILVATLGLASYVYLSLEHFIYIIYYQDDVNGFIEPSSIEFPFVDLKYRKIVQYVNFSGSNADVSNGHGENYNLVA